MTNPCTADRARQTAGTFSVPSESVSRLQILRDVAEFVDQLARGSCLAVPGLLQAMVYVIANQRFLGTPNRFFDRLKLLCELEARAAFGQHFHDVFEVTAGAPQALGDLGVCLVHGVYRYERCKGVATDDRL